MLRFFTCGESLIPNKGTPEDDVTPRVSVEVEKTLKAAVFVKVKSAS